MNKTIKIVVTLSIEGVHSWPECPFEKVAFLRNPHRHMFEIRAEKIVEHNDRDVEIIMLKRNIRDYFANHYGTPCEFGRKSCEMIAEILCEHFNLCYCSVLEDGENGAIVEFNR